MIDLHTHSTCSDGTRTPEELIELAVKAGLEAIALTDHDTVSGIKRFLSAAEGLPIRAVPGVELSSFLHSKEVHVVGLFLNPDTPELLAMLEEQRRCRAIRNDAMLTKLREKGYDITEEDVLEKAHGESVGRPHVAAVLVEKGYFRTMQEAFVRLIGRGASCYVNRIYPTPEQCIKAIHAARGLAVWAHPLTSASSAAATMRKIGKTLAGQGLDALECYYSSFTEKQTADALAFAEKTGLGVSGGSDYHGEAHKGIELGTGGGNLCIPYSTYEQLYERWEKRFHGAGQ